MVRAVEAIAGPDLYSGRLANLDEAVAIGAAGRAHALRHHRAVNRVDAMLRTAVERSS